VFALVDRRQRGSGGLAQRLESRSSANELFGQWTVAQLREFIAAQLDGNLIRVFYR
jgi:hypothetical protein